MLRTFYIVFLLLKGSILISPFIKNSSFINTERGKTVLNSYLRNEIPKPIANISIHGEYKKRINSPKTSNTNIKNLTFLQEDNGKKLNERKSVQSLSNSTRPTRHAFKRVISVNRGRRGVKNSLENVVWPRRRTAVVEGDIIIGGLMMVHEREDSMICGPIMPQGGIQSLETMLYTLDYINAQPNFLPGFKLGTVIHDDCDKDSYGLELTVDFIKDSTHYNFQIQFADREEKPLKSREISFSKEIFKIIFTRSISNIDDGGEYICADGSSPKIRNKVISGVVGAASSVTSIQVANLLRLFKIPQVSYFSTSPMLSNKQRFEYFSRTIPSDHHQVKAMVQLVRVLQWSYVSIIYEGSNYGIKALEELEVELANHNICIAVKEKLTKDSGVADETAYDSIVENLLSKRRARGVIIFGSDQEVAGVMRAVRRGQATGFFSWIGSDGWSARSLVSSGNEPEVEGTLSIQPQANEVKGFLEYFTNLTAEHNLRNPWFVEYWEDHFQCRYPGSLPTPYNVAYTKTCDRSLNLTSKNMIVEAQLQFVSDAVMVFAYALRDLHASLCGGIQGLCQEMKPIKGEDLLAKIRSVSFKGLSGDHFSFDELGDGPARYNIIHFKQISDGNYKWVPVGTYVNGKLDLNLDELQFNLNRTEPPVSVCSFPCQVGQAKQYVEGELCCWHCYNCTKYQIVNPSDETECISCDWGTLPSIDHTFCDPIEEVFLQPDSLWAIGAMGFSTFGIVLTILVIAIFICHNNTPVVRASGRELSYILLIGVLLSFAMTFIFVLKPTNFVCGLQRFGLGFCFAVIYSALLTKTNRIARIFNAGKRTSKRPSLISPKSQICICLIFIMIQVCVIGAWCMMTPPKAIAHYIVREDNFLVCEASVNASYIIAFAYPIGLILICTVYACLTRNIPEAFNESKHIGFTMYTTCIIWLAFVPIYFSTANNIEVRITTTCVTVSLSATVALVCLFVPKLYIIILHPEKNVRQSIMCSTKTPVLSQFNRMESVAHIEDKRILQANTIASKKKVLQVASTQTDETFTKLLSSNNDELAIRKRPHVSNSTANI